MRRLAHGTFRLLVWIRFFEIRVFVQGSVSAIPSNGTTAPRPLCVDQSVGGHSEGDLVNSLAPYAFSPSDMPPPGKEEEKVCFDVASLRGRKKANAVAVGPAVYPSVYAYSANGTPTLAARGR